MEILSAQDDADNKSAKRANGVPQPPLRSFRLPAIEMSAEPSRPAEQLPAKPVQVPEGVLWVSHAEQERHRAIVEVGDDKDDDTGTTKKKKPGTVPSGAPTEQPEIPIEATLLQPPQETAAPHPHPADEVYTAASEADEPIASGAQEVFAYPEAPSSTEWEPAIPEYPAEYHAHGAEPFASPEPLPPIAGFEADTEELPQSSPIPTPRKPLYSTASASAGPPPSPNYGSAPNFNAAPNTPPPPPAQAGPGGGGPPMPPSQPPGASGFNMPPGGPGGPGAYGGNYNAMPAPAAANPNVAPSANPNVIVAPGYNPNRTADWTARFIGLAGFISSRRTRRKLNKRIDKFEAANKRDHKDINDEQLRVRKDQHRQDRDINRLRIDQTRLTNENQRLQQQQRFETPPPMAQPVSAEQQQEATQQQGLELHPDERVVQDTWYSSVVDKHGRVVRDAMQYGESFQKEQQKEAIQDRTAATATPGATLGAGAGFGATQTVGHMGGGVPQAPYGAQPSAPAPMPYQNHQLPSGMTAPALPQGQPTHIDPAHQLPAHTETKKTVSGVAFWVMLAVIVVAFFVAALI